MNNNNKSKKQQLVQQPQQQQQQQATNVWQALVKFMFDDIDLDFNAPRKVKRELV